MYQWICCTECLIEALSWGGNDNITGNGYIAINGNRVIRILDEGWAGFSIAVLDISSCSASLSNIQSFDTSASPDDSDNMAAYINSLPMNTVLIGVTYGDAQSSLTQNAVSALLAIGVDVSGLTVQGKVSFVTQIGQPAESVSQVASAGGSNSKITVKMTGISNSIS